MLKISVCEFHSDLILTVYQGWYFGDINEDGRVCIGDTLLIITCQCFTINNGTYTYLNNLLARGSQ